MSLIDLNIHVFFKVRKFTHRYHDDNVLKNKLTNSNHHTHTSCLCAFLFFIGWRSHTNDYPQTMKDTLFSEWFPNRLFTYSFQFTHTKAWQTVLVMYFNNYNNFQMSRMPWIHAIDIFFNIRFKQSVVKHKYITL